MTQVVTDESDLWRRLERVLQQRIQERPPGSYVAELLEGGHPVLAGKIVEEAYELVEACGEHERSQIIHEAADLVFHTLVLLQTHQIGWNQIEAELSRRFGISGIAEKSARTESH